MNERDTVKAIKTNAPWRDALCLARWADQTGMTSDASEAVLILVLGVDATGRKAIRKLVVPVKNWGWVATLPVTKKIGVAFFVPRSRQALRLVRFLHVSVWQKDNLMLRKRWATYARS